VDSGESYSEAAVRELREELGVESPPLTLVGKLTPCAQTGWEFIEVFTGQHSGPFSPAPLELETLAFFSAPRVFAWAAACPTDFSPVFLLCLDLLKIRTGP
jgi:16S rRNA (adenine1518-N6/adenine1519-N6)-dimethyltransferase